MMPFLYRLYFVALLLCTPALVGTQKIVSSRSSSSRIQVIWSKLASSCQLTPKQKFCFGGITVGLVGLGAWYLKRSSPNATPNKSRPTVATTPQIQSKKPVPSEPTSNIPSPVVTPASAPVLSEEQKKEKRRTEELQKLLKFEYSQKIVPFDHTTMMNRIAPVIQPQVQEIQKILSEKINDQYRSYKYCVLIYHENYTVMATQNGEWVPVARTFGEKEISQGSYADCVIKRDFFDTSNFQQSTDFFIVYTTRSAIAYSNAMANEDLKKQQQKIKQIIDAVEKMVGKQAQLHPTPMSTEAAQVPGTLRKGHNRGDLLQELKKHLSNLPVGFSKTKFLWYPRVDSSPTDPWEIIIRLVPQPPEAQTEGFMDQGIEILRVKFNNPAEIQPV